MEEALDFLERFESGALPQNLQTIADRIGKIFSQLAHIPPLPGR